MANKNKKKAAVAINYQPEKDRAPKILAKGSGKIAEKIIELAKAHGIYIHNDPDLIEVLSQLDLKDEIPPHLYVVIAELLAFIYSLNSGKNRR
jgi:flagellar biosynthesis protein